MEMAQENTLMLAYAQKFWEAGDSVVVLMFGLAFSVYVALSRFPLVRYWAAKYFYWLFVIAIVGNTGLLIVLWCLSVHEVRLIEAVTKDPFLIDAVVSAFHIRLGLFLFNLAMYLTVLGFVRYNVDTSVRPATEETRSN